VSLLTPVWNYVDALVHPSARKDALTAARHRAFIAPRLIGSLGALASLPAYVAFRGVPSALEVVVFCWLVAPILIAYFLSRTGRYESAHILSSLALAGLVTMVACLTGGIGSFAAIWLVVVPLEAALSASRRVVMLASLIALAAAGFLLLLSACELLPPTITVADKHGAFAALGIISASLYAIGLALSAERVVRTGVRLLDAEEARYHLLARNMTDVITRHGKNGAVLFVSPAAEPLFGVRASELCGHGLFDRVHVADRPAYLTALADAMHVEYQAIVDAGFILQIDDPRMATHYNRTVGTSVEECREFIALRVEAVNHALRGLPEDRIRFHTCYSVNIAPRVHDFELRHFVDLMLRVRAGAYLIEAANPRHEHEWRIWQDVPLPDGKILIPGVVSHCVHLVEHPELVAQRIVRFAEVVGRERVIAGTDCGFGTSGAGDEVHPEVAWAKLAALVEGARIASHRLW